MAWNSAGPQISIHPTTTTTTTTTTATMTATVDESGSVDQTRKQSILELFLSGCAIMGSMGIGLAGNPEASFARTLQGSELLGNAVDGLKDCPGQPVKKACWSTEDKEGLKLQPWLPPAGMSSQQILQDLLDTIAQYPQTGQNDVDGGGWKLIEQTTVGDNTYVHYEFISGKFRFKDDLEFLVNAPSGNVSVRSASRNAGFDYGVNATRLNYIAKLLLAKGWQVSLL